MVDRDKIEGLIRRLREYAQHLQKLSKLNQATFLQDPFAVGSARYYLLVSIEICIDIANHIISAKRLRSPKDYRDAFRVLNEAGIVPEAFSQTLQAMAGLRNLLVHLYWEVDDAMIFDSLRTELRDFEVYIGHIMRYLDEELRQETQD